MLPAVSCLKKVPCQHLGPTWAAAGGSPAPGSDAPQRIPCCAWLTQPRRDYPRPQPLLSNLCLPSVVLYLCGQTLVEGLEVAPEGAAARNEHGPAVPPVHGAIPKGAEPLVRRIHPLPLLTCAGE